jgi:membrane protein
VVVLLFVGLMRIGSGPKPPLRCLLFGAAVGALLFTVGKQLLALYLTRAAVVSAYGAAGSLVVFLMWMYFSSAVLLFAASCARALYEARQAAAG